MSLRPAAGPDRGSGTVLMLALVIFSGFLVLVTAVLAAAIVARHRAEAAADLAALAAASGLSASDGCAEASRIAAANGSRLEKCRRLPDGSMLVGVQLQSGGRVLLPAVHAVARAGIDAGEGR
jgi:secretion/DNA translocation related TadE-like protein